MSVPLLSVNVPAPAAEPTLICPVAVALVTMSAPLLMVTLLFQSSALVLMFTLVTRAVEPPVMLNALLVALPPPRVTDVDWR